MANNKGLVKGRAIGSNPTSERQLDDINTNTNVLAATQKIEPADVTEETPTANDDSQSDAPKKPEKKTVEKEKRTFHLDPDVVLLLGQLQGEIWQETKKKPNLSDLVTDGIKLLAEQRASAR